MWQQQMSTLLSVLLLAWSAVPMKSQPLVILQLIVKAVTALSRAQPRVPLGNHIVAPIAMQPFQRTEVERLLFPNPQHIEVLIAEVPNRDVLHVRVIGRQRQERCVLHVQLFHPAKWDASISKELCFSV